MTVDPHFLLPSQKRTALQICAKHGIPTHEFEWKETVIGKPELAPRVSQLVHVPTNYYFTFDFTPGGSLIDRFSPGKDEAVYESPESLYWTTRWGHVEGWAEYVAREIEALQFLATAMHDAPDLQRFALESGDNQPFSDVERDEIIERLNAVEVHVLECRSFQEVEALFVHRQFDHLRSESSRTGRISWVQMTVGVMVSIIAAFFQGDTARQLWQYLNSQLGQFLRLGP